MTGGIVADPRRTNPPPAIRDLGAQDLDVVFQPIVDATDGALFAVEGLVRCNRNEYRSPLALFDEAVAQEACGRLGRTVREVAFERVAGTAIFVNIHPKEISSRWLVRPDDPLCFHDHDVYLEITEAAAFEYFDLCSDVLREVCARTGAKLVVDDFGAGYSNLERIVDLEPSVVKLDRSLIVDLHRHGRKRTLVTHLVRLCADLGATVVAEGIEVVDELRAVQDCGVQLVQGYLLARPSYPIPAIHWPAE